ncbi:MAG: hypothetical protein KGQ46_03620 [Hyphomicrobiales bacterium]|nr:hypothetical protein [Hyphomicrobiales bacterium]MDE2115213.1 hypothetical protein [Hyphomicrobiales bacterium]
MKYAIVAAMLGSLVIVSGAQAKGCIKGAIVGGVAGHYAGHHGLLGAASGCVLGHERAKAAAQKKKQMEEQQKMQQQNSMQPANPGAAKSDSPVIPAK